MTCSKKEDREKWSLKLDVAHVQKAVLRRFPKRRADIRQCVELPNDTVPDVGVSRLDEDVDDELAAVSQVKKWFWKG